MKNSTKFAWFEFGFILLMILNLIGIWNVSRAFLQLTYVGMIFVCSYAIGKLDRIENGRI